MTTIAVKNGIIAYDSRVTRDDVIIQDDVEKSFKLNDGSVAFRAGLPADDKYLIENWDTCSIEASDKSIPNVHAFVVDPNGKLWRAAFDSEGNFYKERVPCTRECDAIGSGYQFALAAMDMGASAEDAVHIATQRDIYSGGKIRTFEISKGIEK